MTREQDLTTDPNHVDLRGSMAYVMMSDELKDRIDVNEDILVEGDNSITGDTRDVVMASTFSCGVTLSDGEERLGDVLSFERAGLTRVVSFVTTDRIVDDIACADEIQAVRLFSRRMTNVFDCSFDLNDPGDQPHIRYTVTEVGHVLTLSFSVGSDTYTKYTKEDTADE